MDKSRNRYDLYRKYKKSSSPKETSPISRVTFHHELIENTHANDDTLVRNQDDDATHAKNKMRSRFQNILTLPDLSVSQLDDSETPRFHPISNSVNSSSNFPSDITSTELLTSVQSDSSVIQHLNLDLYQQSQDTRPITETSVEESNIFSTSLEEDSKSSRLGQPLLTQSDKFEANKANHLPLSALHRRFQASTALSPTRLHSTSHDELLDKVDAPENNNYILKKSKSLELHSITSSEKRSFMYVNPIKPKAIQHDRDQSIGSITAIDTTTTTSDSANSSSLLTPRNEPSATVIVPNASGIFRPTEAQLRWSQYHRKERARKSQLYIEKLMKTPLLPNIISGMISGDDDSYTSYEDFQDEGDWKDIVNQPHLLRRRKKDLGLAKKAKNNNVPNLSVGRRVLLRVSARLSQERREMILEHGFEMEPDSDDHDDEIGRHSVRDISAITGESFQSDPTSVPGSIIGLTVNAKKSKKSRKTHLKGRKSIVNSALEDEDRIKRFQEAYAALFNAVLSMQQASNTNMDDVDRENMKRWSRGSIASAISIDGREYYDLQRAPSIRYDKLRDQSLYELIDRGASWLMHLPKQEKIIFLTKLLSENKTDTIVDDSKLEEGRFLDLIKQMELYSENACLKILEKGQNHSEKSRGDRININTNSYETDDDDKLIEERQNLASIVTSKFPTVNNYQSTKIPSSERNVYSHTCPDIDTEATSTIGSTKPQKLPPVYRGPITRQGATQNSQPDSDILLKISTWRSENESIDMAKASQDMEDTLSPGDGLIEKNTSAIGQRRNQSEEAIVNMKLCDSLFALDIDTTSELSPITELTSTCTVARVDKPSNRPRLDLTPALKSWTVVDFDEASLTSPTDTFTDPTQTLDNNSCHIAVFNCSEFSNDEIDEDAKSTSHPIRDSGDITSSEKNFIVSDSDEERVLSTYSKTESKSGNNNYDVHSLDDNESLGDIEASLRYNHTFIDTDKASDVSESAAMEDRIMIGNLMLTPEILNKRLHQAISSIQARSWEEVFYLLSANPWLAEMTEIASKQCLLHQLSFHGASDEVQSNDAAPEELNEHLIEMFPHAAQKLDCKGNLPIHHAAMSLNEDMVPRLVEIFPSGLSVQNFNGHLPLHLSIYAAAESSLVNQAISSIGCLLNIFPDALAVQDHDGNLPLHLAASCLTGELAIGIISMMVSKIEKETIFMRVPTKRNRENLEKYLSTDPVSYDFRDFEVEEVGDSLSILSIKNHQTLTPLMCAIKTNCDWDVINIFLGAKQYENGVLTIHEDGKSILQMAIASCTDPATILNIIKIAPPLVRIRDENGVLPIEAICSRPGVPSKIIAAMVLVDLPTNETTDEGSILSVSIPGASWWWINCSCDDRYVNIVREILTMTNSHQKRIMCSACNADGISIMDCASSKCRKELQKAQRFAGRFELQRELHDTTERTDGVKLFDAVDFRLEEDIGVRVLLQCYSQRNNYMNDAFLFDGITLNYNLVEENEALIINDSPHRFCFSTEIPSQSLASFLKDATSSMEYGAAIKNFVSILLTVGESIKHLHDKGIIHGAVSKASVGRFGKNWKLTKLAGSRRMKSYFGPLRLGYAAPPEAVDRVVNSEGTRYILRHEVLATPAIDIWAFGKLFYELLSGHQLAPCDSQQRSVYFLAQWNDERLLSTVDMLEKSPIGSLAADLVFYCLSPNPQNRPRSMNDVLSHSFWRSTR